MNAWRVLSRAVALALSASAATAQTTHAHTPTAPDMAAPMPAAEAMPPMMDTGVFSHVLLDQFEGRTSGTNTSFRWDGQAWLGTDYDKLWIKSEGFVRSDGKVDDGRHEFLYDRAITTYFDLQGGIRSDLDSRPTRNWAAFGIQGLAPLFFELEATGYVSDQGHFAGKLHASYDLLITQRLILQPEAELNFYSKADPARLIGAGLSDIDTGLRLRYELSRKFAPYLGVAYEGKLGQTAKFARNAGESTGAVRFVFGIRSWF
jgi:copper resistance protein B